MKACTLPQESTIDLFLNWSNHLENSVLVVAGFV